MVPDLNEIGTRLVGETDWLFSCSSNSGIVHVNLESSQTCPFENLRCVGPPVKVSFSIVVFEHIPKGMFEPKITHFVRTF